MSTVRAFLVDPNRLSRDGIGRIFTDTPYAVSGEGHSLDSLLNRSEPRDGAPDLVLADIGTLGTQLFDNISALRSALPNTRVVILVNRQDVHRVIECFSAGVDGCIMKDISSAALIEKLDLVMLGERVFPSQVLSMMMRDSTPVWGGGKPSAAVSDARLSERETQILRCLVGGSANKVIANRLGVTEATVKVHLKSILRKIKAQNRTQAAIWALNQGLAEEQTAQREHV